MLMDRGGAVARPVGILTCEGERMKLSIVSCAAGLLLTVGVAAGQSPISVEDALKPVQDQVLGDQQAEQAKPAAQERTLESGLKIVDVQKAESAPVAQNGDAVFVHYTGRLEDGTQFDSSRDRGQPFGFRLGEGSVIKGWEEGIAGMKIGDKRQLIIPPSLAYGEEGRPPTIPANATLIFDVELVGLVKLGQ